MSLSTKEITLVKDSWQVINPVSRKMGEEFYARLFEKYPEFQPLFKSDPKDQAMKLMFMLSYLVHRLDNVDEMKAEIAKLAGRHKSYGTNPGHFRPLGEVLMWSLKTNLGDHWTTETAEAWRKTYELRSKLMIEATSAPRV